MHYGDVGLTARDFNRFFQVSKRCAGVRNWEGVGWLKKI